MASLKILIIGCATIENYIDGTEFLSLSMVKDMVPPIGLAKKIARLLPSCQACCCTMLLYCDGICVFLLDSSQRH